MNEEQTTFESSGRSLFAWLYEPDTSNGTGLVICAPIFEERKCTHRVLVDTARACASRGATVLRFDYRGCGDSDGNFADHSVDDWVADTRAAMSFLQERAGVERLNLLGARCGATLAVLAADGADVERLILWQPIARGNAYFRDELRQKLMKEMVTFGRSQSTRESLIQDLEGGRSIDFDGYEISPRLYADLDALDLTAETKGLSTGVLCIELGRRPEPSAAIRQTSDSLRKRGAAVELRVVDERPFWKLIGLTECPELIRTSIDWLSQATTSRNGGD